MKAEVIKMIEKLPEKTNKVDKRAEGTLVGPDGDTSIFSGNLVILSAVETTDSLSITTVINGYTSSPVYAAAVICSSVKNMTNMLQTHMDESIDCVDTIHPRDRLIMSVLFSPESANRKKELLSSISKLDSAGDMSDATAAYTNMLSLLNEPGKSGKDDSNEQ